jgi:hypothetical protein
VHETAFSKLNLPRGHKSHIMLFVTFEYLPDSQVIQTDLPDSNWYSPAEQSEHIDWPVFDPMVPLEQLKHIESPEALLNIPRSQA